MTPSGLDSVNQTLFYKSYHGKVAEMMQYSAETASFGGQELSFAQNFTVSLNYSQYYQIFMCQQYYDPVALTCS